MWLTSSAAASSRSTTCGSTPTLAAARRDRARSAGWRHAWAPARYLADRLIQARHDTVFPWGTFAVNIVGSAILGFLLGARAHLGLPSAAFALLGTGLCGGLTTFSAFGYETLRLIEDRALGEAGLNVAGSLAAAVLVAWLGFRLAIALLGPTRGPRDP